VGIGARGELYRGSGLRVKFTRKAYIKAIKGKGLSVGRIYYYSH